MTSGGSRLGAGRKPESYKVKKVLPVEGYAGEIPPIRFIVDPTPLEQDIYRCLWSSPQAAEWQEWQHQFVEMYARLAAAFMTHSTNGSQVAGLLRLGDQIGITQQGLANLGWQIGNDAAADGGKPAAVAYIHKRRLQGGK